MNDFLNISLYLFLLISSLKMSARISKDSLAIDEPRGNETYFCDACGCASTGGSMGFSSLSGGSFIGLRYLGQEYRSRDGIYENSAWIEEYFNTLQLWANYPVSDRISVSAILPYHFHHRQFANATSQQISGIGDFSILGFYKVFREYQQEYLDAEQTDFRQELRFGGGIKLPLGSYQRANNEGSVNPGFQLGTGSWDFILAGSYQLNYRDWGGKLQANYILKQENQQGYRFGNQLNTSLLFYRNFSWIDLKKVLPVNLVLYSGVAQEIFGKNRSFGQPVQHTRGSAVFGKLGAEFSYGKWNIGASYIKPLAQNLNNGQVVAKNRLSLSLNYLL